MYRCLSLTICKTSEQYITYSAFNCPNATSASVYLCVIVNTGKYSKIISTEIEIND